MKKLKRKFRLVANEKKEIVIQDEFQDGTETCTNQPYAFEFDTLINMRKMINELQLIDSS